MSWKSLVTAGLLCVLASPAFAVGPTMALVSNAGSAANGHLDASGNWIWTVTVTPDVSLVPDTSGTPVAVELGFTSSTIAGKAGTPGSGQGNVKTAVRNPANGTGSFDTINPGTAVFTSWQTTANGLLDTNSNNRPTGIQLSATGVGTNAGVSYTANSSFGGTDNQVFAALGSVNFTTGTAKTVMNITTQRPVVDATNFETTTKIQVQGAYSGNGRITQVTGLSGSTYTTSNYDTFGGASFSYAMHARGGDSDLDGTVGFSDYSPVSNNYGQPGVYTWAQGDYTGDGAVGFDDYSFVSNHYLDASYNYNVGVITPAAGSGSGGGLSGGSVPEPASVALLGLAVLGGLGIIRRKR